MVTDRDSKSNERASPTTVHGSAGHVEVDSRGNSVWQWKKQSPLDTTTILLKRLENDALALESSAKLPQPKAPLDEKGPKRGATGAENLSVERSSKRGGGFDPYNST